MHPGFSAKAARDPYAHIDADALYRALANTKLKGRPGLTKMRYSNFGVGLLGHALGLATGTGYQQGLHDVVLEQLGLTSTDFTDDNLHQGRHRKRPVAPWHLNELAGAGGLRSNAADVRTFLEAVRDQDGPLAEAIKQTLIPRSQGRMSVGLGWFILNDGQLLMHNGGTLGARTEVRLERRTGLGVVVFGDSRRGTGATAAKLLSPQ